MLFSVCISCNRKTLSKELTDNFSSSEIDDLLLLSKFFQNQMCGNEGSFKECMDSIIPFIGEYGFIPIEENIDFALQQGVYNDLRSAVFTEIWEKCKIYNPIEGWERVSLCVNPDGRYIKFLSDLGKRNGVLEAYKEGLLSGGSFFGITRIEYEVFTASERIDLSDEAIQVLVAIHYLTQNDNSKRIEPWVEE